MSDTHKYIETDLNTLGGYKETEVTCFASDEYRDKPKFQPKSESKAQQSTWSVSCQAASASGMSQQDNNRLLK